MDKIETITKEEMEAMSINDLKAYNDLLVLIKKEMERLYQKSKKQEKERVLIWQKDEIIQSFY